MQETMQKFASVYKDKDLLEKGYSKLLKLTSTKNNNQVIKPWVWNTDLIEALELKNMIDLSKCNCRSKFI